MVYETLTDCANGSLCLADSIEYQSRLQLESNQMLSKIRAEMVANQEAAAAKTSSEVERKPSPLP